MPELTDLIIGSEKLTSLFDGLRSFHDAEVLEIHFWRGHIDTDAQIYNFPVLTVKIHLWLMTNNADARGYYERIRHTLVTIKFFDVDNFKMEGFNHQNAIFGLDIEQKTREEGPTPYFSVNFDPAFGIDASFTCQRIEVSEARHCSPEGAPI
jgi:hypothetical protein